MPLLYRFQTCERKNTFSEKVRRSKSATPIKKSTKPASKVVRIPSGQATAENGPEAGEKTLGTEDVVVSQEYVQGVQSIFNFGKLLAFVMILSLFVMSFLMEQG